LDDVILNPIPQRQSIRDAFRASYGPESGKNQFTKVQMNVEAHRQLLDYFADNAARIIEWFNVIAPMDRNLEHLQREIQTLQGKEWGGIVK